MKFMRLLAALMALVWTAPARADVCELMDKPTAEAFAAVLVEAGSFVYLDWFKPVTVASAEVVADGDLYVVLVNGAMMPDAAYTYVPKDDATFANAGLPLGCEGADVTATIPRQPFAADPSPAPALVAPEVDRVIGIVETPALFDAYLAMAELEQPVALRAKATTSVPVAALAATLEELEMAEVDYDVMGAMAYGIEHDWYRVKRDGELLWLPPEAAGPFHPFPDLLVESLSYLDAAWDGVLYDTPRGDAPRQHIDPAWRAAMGGAIDVDVRGLWVTDGVPWVLLDVIWPPPCGDGEDMPAPVATGWVPAYAVGGAPNVWYYSRGC